MTRQYSVFHRADGGDFVLLRDGAWAPESSAVCYVDNAHRGRTLLYAPRTFDTLRKANAFRKACFGHATRYFCRAYCGPMVGA